MRGRGAEDKGKDEEEEEKEEEEEEEDGEEDGEEDVIDVDSGEASSDWRPSPCHRLDVGTGGLLLVAKSRRAAADMCRQLKERKVKKTYHAVVVGLLQVRSGVKLSM